MRDDRLRLVDMAESIRKIEKYTSRGKEAFDRDELLHVWIVHHLQILGEAARGISKESQQRYSQIPWAKSIGFRNILVHHYFAIDGEEIWGVIQSDIPPLKRALHRIIHDSCWDE